MGLFKKRTKGTEPLRTLSEKEIQKKLYGQYCAGRESLTVAPTKSPEKASIDVPTVEVAQARGDLFTSSQSPSEIEFEESTAQDILKGRTRPARVRPEDSADVRRTRRVAFIPTPNWKDKSKKKIRFSFPRWMEFQVPYRAIIGSTGRALGKALYVLINFPKDVARFLYLKRRTVRKVVSWGISIFLITLLFAAVNYLNVKREKAMKGTAEPTRVAEVSNALSLAETSQADTLTTTQTEEPSVSGAEERFEATEPISVPDFDRGRFVVQVATYANEEDAGRIASRLRMENRPSFVRGFSRSRGKVYYSVFIGRFQTYREAQRAFEQFQGSETAAPFMDAFIRMLKE